METAGRYEHYPIGIVLASNFVSISIYTLGVLIMLNAAFALAAMYLVFILVMELRLLSMHCTNCYYRGKSCAFGKGRISAWFFIQGDTMKFCAKKMTWKEMIPDLLISLVPLVTGIAMLIISFNIILLSEMVLIVALTTLGNSYVRGSLACNHCKQRDLGCPAYELFNSSSHKDSRNL